MKQVATRLNFLLKADFGLRTRQVTIIQPIDHPKKSREQLKIEIEDPDRETRFRQIQEAENLLKFEQSIFNIRQNDNNPKNHIQVKVHSQVPQKVIQQPLIVPKLPRAKKVLIIGTRRKVPASLKKLFPQCRSLIGLHLYEALERVSASHKKVSKTLGLALNMVKAHAIQQGYDPDRLYVHALVSGKYMRWQRMRYHAKSRMGKGQKDTTQLRVELEEKPALEFFKGVVEGKTPAVMGQYLKHQLVETNANYEQVRKFQHFLTAKGRQQQRLMIKRRVQQELLQNKEQNKKISFSHIEKRIVLEEAQELVANYEKSKSKAQQSNLQERQTLFKRNEEANN